MKAPCRKTCWIVGAVNVWAQLNMDEFAMAVRMKPPLWNAVNPGGVLSGDDTCRLTPRGSSGGRGGCSSRPVSGGTDRYGRFPSASPAAFNLGPVGNQADLWRLFPAGALWRFASFRWISGANDQNRNATRAIMLGAYAGL